MSIKNILIILLAATLLSGCASTGNQKLGKMTAAEIDSTFHKGMTRKQVIALLGAPTKVETDAHKNDVWYYSYTKSHLMGKDLLSVFKELRRPDYYRAQSSEDKKDIVTSDKTKQLIFVFHNKKVIKYKQVYKRGESDLGSL